MPPRRLPLLLFIFALSGVSALVFETLWFRQAGITFGNSFWASSLVLSSFMGGMALGNGLGARLGDRLGRPLLVYAGLELAIAASGVGLLVLLPSFASVFAPVFRPLIQRPELLQPLRFALAFALLLAPATAMGATLPILLRAASEGREYGALLGRLYGWNTLGAVVGAVLSEAALIPRLGIFGAGCVAATLNTTAALLAATLLRGAPAADATPGAALAPARASLSVAAWRLLLAAFLSGGLLLALEVVWFRVLVLFIIPSEEGFAWMLAVVLAGIGCGGLVASRWLRWQRTAPGYVSAIALLSGATALVCYGGVGLEKAASLVPYGSLSAELTTRPILLSLALLFPTCFLSGLLFPFLGERLHQQLEASARATGLLALANTLGAMLGPLLAGFVLIPRIGLTGSVQLLSVAYAGVALLALGPARAGAPRLRAALQLACAAGLVVVLLGSSGNRVQQRYLESLARRYATDSERVIRLHEGLLETTVYQRGDYLGEPHRYRLVTDSYSMSATGPPGERYMSLFVHLPAALHPGPKQALLISFGLGVTARTLADLPELERIDVVDISPDILEQSEVVFPDPATNPLRDPRVTTYVEDGRYFLQTTPRRYDLITAEPPPPAAAGVVNLYTSEYFELIRERLREGGFASYWLPVEQMDPTEARAIVAAFCASFPDCSLWAGAGMEWILLGSRDARGGLSEQQISWQWSDATLGAHLAAVGLERPEQLGATFLADSAFLAAWSGTTPPLVDDRPGRAPRMRKVVRGEAPQREYAEIMEPSGARQRFEKSELIRRFWPEELRRRTGRYFGYEQLARELLMYRIRTLRMAPLHDVLTQSELRTLPLWLLGSDARRQQIALRHLDRSAAEARVRWELALAALAARDYALAAQRFADVRSPLAEHANAPYLEIYALAMAGRLDEARSRARARFVSSESAPPHFWSFLSSTFGVDPRAAS